MVREITKGAGLAGGSIATDISTLFRIVRRTLGSNRGIRIVNFNGFRIHSHTTHGKHGPRAKRRVRVRTDGVPTFGPNGTLGSTIGWFIGVGLKPCKTSTLFFLTRGSSDGLNEIFTILSERESRRRVSASIRLCSGVWGGDADGGDMLGRRLAGRWEDANGSEDRSAR